ncbi:MAG: ABC transporter ATP-binding protein [Clostridia bacterium]|nr:ABC transporter ATP-binding protein [Clostridia bacterium]
MTGENKANENNVLRLTDITMQFGGVVAINNLSLEVNTGEIVALIGPNGAGKTTAFNCITGVYEPTNGAVYFHGKPIAVNHPQGKMVKQYSGINADKYKDQKAVVYTPDKITHMGIARTFQNIRLFKSQTAFENVLIGTHLRRTSNFLTASFRLNAKEEKAMQEKARNLLEIVGLADVGDELATSLPYGKQRRLEIARALATDPTLLLLDEPAAGMNPQETDELGEFIVDIKNRFDLTVFMIEHHMNLVMDISDRIYVLDFGKQIAEGTPDEIQKNPVVIAAYLGVDEE